MGEYSRGSWLGELRRDNEYSGLPSVDEAVNFSCLNLRRLIKEGICDKSSVPSVSAISRLLRGRDEEEVKKTSKSNGAKTVVNCSHLSQL